MVDFELGNWFSCSHPTAIFVNHLVATLVTAEGRISILDREFTLRTLDGHASTNPIHSPEELLEILADRFELSFPPDTRFPIPAAPTPV